MKRNGTVGTLPAEVRIEEDGTLDGFRRVAVTVPKRGLLATVAGTSEFQKCVLCYVFVTDSSREGFQVRSSALSLAVGFDFEPQLTLFRELTGISGGTS